jgi:TolB protein
MPSMKPLTRRTLWVTIAGFVTCARSQQAAADQRRVSIAVPEFSGDSVSDDVSPRNITEIVVSDLKASGRFVFIEPDGSIEEKVGAAPQFKRWRDLNTEYLIIGRIARKPDQRVFVEFRLWDVVSGQHLVGVQYVLQSEDWRRVSHAIAEAVIERLIGRT